MCLLVQCFEFDVGMCCICKIHRISNTSISWFLACPWNDCLVNIYIYIYGDWVNSELSHGDSDRPNESKLGVTTFRLTSWRGLIFKIKRPLLLVNCTMKKKTWQCSSKFHVNYWQFRLTHFRAEWLLTQLSLFSWST